MTGKAAWVTGANGFVGRHLSSTLRQHGWTVVGFGRSVAEGLPLTVEGFEQAVALHGRPRRAFHLAGGATVGRSILDPLADFDSNVVTTARLLDAIRQLCPDCSVVVASSSAVYGARHSDPIPTHGALQPFSPYGQHKRMAELLAFSYAESFGLRGTVFRFFSIYGPGLRKQLLFDICAQLAASADPVRLGGSGKELRDWCHVDDAVRAMIDIDTPKAGAVETFNIGTGTGVSVHEVAAELVAQWGDSRQIEFSGQSRPGDPFSLIAAKESLPPGFRPRVTPNEGFAQFVDWFRTNHSGGEAQ